MKKLYLIARNHMDPSWLRCFTESYTHPETGETVRPYADVEETQILEYMDFAEKYGVKYQIEQSLVVKKFLERNPDQFERFRRLVQKGLLELAGGGEAVIDCNLTRGESWARNHLYSRTYYEKTFGHRPRYAITPDIFGLPSQLPQFFRSVGYDALIIFDRVLKNNKPFWRGLDGTLIVLDACFLQPPEPNLRTADCVKLPACAACGGEGCAFCEGTGIDTTYDMTRPDKALLKAAYYGNMSADIFLETLLKTDKEEYFVMITTEEPRIGGFLYGPLKDAAARHGIEVRYLGFEENHEVWCRGQEELLRSGNTPAELIDTRVEGNPAACGCYTSRIEIKKANAELEQLLFEAENLAAAVRLQGGWREDKLPRRDYPAKKLEALWNKMAFIQFHDCVTGTHVDAAYGELLRYIREVRRGAYQIYAEAAREWCRLHNTPVPDGYFCAVYFNPTQEAEALPQIFLNAPNGTGGVKLFDTDLNPIPAFDMSFSTGLVDTCITLRAEAAVPAFGSRVFFWKPTDAPERITGTDVSKGRSYVQNAFFRIVLKDGQIEEILDLKNRRRITGAGGAYLAIGNDDGGPYARAQRERRHCTVKAEKTTLIETEAYRKIIFSGLMNAPENGVKKLKWTQTVTLYKNEALVRFRTELDWDGENTRVFASFPIEIQTDGKLWCEVPFGMQAREDPGNTNLMGITDEWPTLGYAGVSNGGCSIAVLKNGFPGARYLNGALEISLMRAVTCGDPRYKGMNDVGRHTAEYALAAWNGAFADGAPAAKAAAFIRMGYTHAVAAPGLWREPKEQNAPGGAICAQTLLPFLQSIPDEIRVSAVKWAEDGSGPAVRFWESAGKTPTLELPAGTLLLYCDTLEQPTAAQAVSAYRFRPFEIATFRLVKP